MPDRNPKVRRRLAAGKLRLRLCDLRNLGPRSERLLAEIGIRTPEELRRKGALEAYLELRRRGSSRSLNLLWALVGAIEPWPEGRDWRDVAASEARLPMMLAVDAHDSARRAVRAAETSRATTDEDESTAGETGTWVPGLPFEGVPPPERATSPGATKSRKATSRKKKNRR